MKAFIHLFLLAVATSYFSCESKQEHAKIPVGVLSSQKIENYLYDLHLLEAKLQQSGIRQDTSTKLFLEMEKDLLKLHKIDSASLKKSLKFYSLNVELMDTIYSHLLKRGQKEK